MAAARAALETVAAEGLPEDEAVAVATMREGLVTAASYSLPGIEGDDAERHGTPSSTPVACARSMRRSPRPPAP